MRNKRLCLRSRNVWIGDGRADDEEETKKFEALTSRVQVQCPDASIGSLRAYHGTNPKYLGPHRHTRSHGAMLGLGGAQRNILFEILFLTGGDPCILISYQACAAGAYIPPK